MDDEAPHNKTRSKQVQDMITSFKLKMGYNNFLITNALRKLEEGVDTAQQAAAEVAEQGAEVEQQPPLPRSADSAVRWDSQQHPQQEQRFPPGI